MEDPLRTPGHPDQKYWVNRGAFRLPMHLFLHFVIIMVLKGLLIACANYLLRVNAGECGGPKLNPVYEDEKSTDGEKLQLHAEIQRLTELLHNITTDSRCQLCPKTWHRYKGHCYFISAGLEEDRKWVESVEYCAEHNASLAVFQHEAEMEFILSLLSRFEEMPFLWLGLTDAQVEGVWAWQDGTLLQNHSIKVQWDSEHRDCADLRGDGSVFASDCMSYSPWLCKKPMVPPEF
ncbi:CD209 antigen-like protein E isoform X2 [Silurus meridionalis]|uniref:CD209 antigen-like protein E isoform X2 n=1 Tax=Silurus meridionalis TaxID=175797 RepID=UPI001EEA1E51|nr:CD209 antigen-like protein E isoform X2 [Silurus meridionalis]